jgi:hypothetical protein
MPSENTLTGECYINRLPIELLGAIFEEHSVLEVSAPFIDSQVCRRWHITTHIWPRAWSYITMRSLEHGVSLNRYKTLLERSGDSPLHVNLEYSGFSHMKPSIVLLFQRPAVTRIQKLFLHGWLPGEIQMVESMPNLRTLQFWECDWESSTMFLLSSKGFPLLDELVVYGRWYLPNMARGTPAPLRTLSFSCMRLTVWAKILLECRETLVEVFLHRCTPPPPAQIHLPNLKFLALSEMRDFRNDIVAPRLITFHERLAHLDPIKMPFAFSSITEYACQGSFPSADDEPLLGECVLPKLERLVLWGTWEGIGEVLWNLLAHQHYLPKLNTIELATADGLDLCRIQWATLERSFVHTPLSSILERRTGSRASYAPLCFSLVRDSPALAIHILIPPLETFVSLQSVNNITGILVTRLT